MQDSPSVLWCLPLFVIIGICIGGWCFDGEKIKQQAIDRDYAYKNIDGEFTWRKSDKEKIMETMDFILMQKRLMKSVR